ncbi:Versicolorin B desaturase [Colletotrichum gloeosporioides]|uniref:Versicolorin B desaturase n=1 Tax=Colletotrichum gloeosporioides TaxID=474922 RepID=A0A8H4CUS2_COLGL|nr:Versicolorin B desaturase [Colletotrichum gloeosporioides]KAF3810382.1 Versicolorin B desaturase [Colletotrichum gloeosporioides]
MDIKDIIDIIDQAPVPRYVLLPIGAIVLYVVFKVVYNLYFHPLRKFPGPVANKLSIIPHLWSVFKGKQSYELLRLHSKYGHVVRYGPNELSFSSAKAWKDIYGPRSGHQPFTKGTWYDGLSIYAAQDIRSIITERDPVKHAAMSRLYGGAFSRGFLNEMEPMIIDYIDRFVDYVRSKTADGGTVDLTFGYSSMTFDIIGDLAFGQDFGAIGLEEPHKFIRELNESLGFTSFMEAVKRFPPLGPIGRVLLRSQVEKLEGIARKGGDFALEVMKKRVAEQDTTTRKDFLTKVLQQRAESKMDISEIQLAAQSWDFIGAGTETTAAVMTSTTYYLLKDRDLLARVTAEVRAAFRTSAEITNASAEKLELLHRVCLEGLRLPTGAPPILPRLVPKGGDTVDGYFLPGGTPVTIAPMVAGLHPDNFKDPMVFNPDRWLGKGGDILEASQPFSLGARGCGGKPIAWMEVRVTLAKMLWTFDMELENPDLDWIGKDFDNLPQYALWVRQNLHIKARVASH